jgi:glycerate 2-kinase
MLPISAEIGFSFDRKTAFIEMARASGLELIRPEGRNPLFTTTFGTGEFMLAAMKEGCTKIIMGIGGSATNDGGAGMAQALGVRLLNKYGKSIEPGGGYLTTLQTIDLSGMAPHLPEIVVACDVSKPLTGPSGASAVYGPQKGADSGMVILLDLGLKNYGRIIEEQLGIDVGNVPGAGAAGGLGAGLMAFCQARLTNGFQLFADTTGLEEKIAAADLVITGEGKMDNQTLQGKAPFGVAQLAKKYGKPVIGVAGTLGSGFEKLYENGFDVLLSVITQTMTLQEAMLHAPGLVRDTGYRIGKILNFKI